MHPENETALLECWAGKRMVFKTDSTQGPGLFAVVTVPPVERDPKLYKNFFILVRDGFHNVFEMEAFMKSHNLMYARSMMGA